MNIILKKILFFLIKSTNCRVKKHNINLMAGLFFCSPVLAFECLIEPMQTVELASPVTGILNEVMVGRADLIKKGQILAGLESGAEEIAVEIARFKSVQQGPEKIAKARVDFALRKFNRRHEMVRERLMPVQERDDAEAELRLSEAEFLQEKETRQLAILEHQQQLKLLELRNIRSPFDGVVLDQMVYPGEVVEPSSNRAIFRIAQLSPLKVRVIVPKDHFGRISSGMLAEVVPERPVEGMFEAHVDSIDRMIDAASGTFVIMLNLPNPDFSIPAGIKCNAKFVNQ